MSARAALIALVVGACWTSSPGPAPPPLRPEPAASATPVKPPRQTRWKTSPAFAQRPPAPPSTSRVPADIARDLAAELRTSGPNTLPSFIAGPIVVLDLDASTVSTLCDASAISAAQSWGRMLADPGRPGALCRAGASYSCTQFAQSAMLIVELADPDQWRIVSVIVGNYRNGRATLHSKMAQVRAQIATAACP